MEAWGDGSTCLELLLCIPSQSPPALIQPDFRHLVQPLSIGSRSASIWDPGSFAPASSARPAPPAQSTCLSGPRGWAGPAVLSVPGSPL